MLLLYVDLIPLQSDVYMRFVITSTELWYTLLVTALFRVGN